MKGPVPGFSRGVNDGLIAASSLVHFKAAGLLGFALTLSGIVVSQQPSHGMAANLHYGGIFLLVASALLAGAAIYPMKNTRRGGLIFWGDIRLCETAAAYAEELSKLETPEIVDREYAFTNFRLSEVLDAKYRLIRWSIALLLFGTCSAGFARMLT